jgi:hypothetical protein
MFVADTILAATSWRVFCPEIEYKLRVQEIQNAKTWLDANKLTLNEEKNEYTAISIKVVHVQCGKVEYERERLLGIVNKLINFQSDSQQPFALAFDFSALLVDNLN